MYRALFVLERTVLLRETRLYLGTPDGTGSLQAHSVANRKEAAVIQLLRLYSTLERFPIFHLPVFYQNFVLLMFGQNQA